MDNLLLITLLAIFLTALVSAYLRRRRRDRALKEFDGYHCALALWDGGCAWGRLRVYANGLELIYPQVQPDRDGRPRTSFVLFQEHYDRVKAIYRYRDELTPENQQRRAQDLERSFHPGPWRRSKRWLRNFVDTFRDAINEALGLWLSRVKGGRRGRALQGQDARLQQLGAQVVGEVGTAYDPILERYVGHCAVLEHRREETFQQCHWGVLKEYSPAWLSLLDCREQDELAIRLDQPERLRLQRRLDFLVRARPEGVLELRADNRGGEPLRLVRITGEGYERALEQTLPPGESVTAVLDDLPETLRPPVEAVREWSLVAPERAAGEASADLSLPALELVIAGQRVVDLCLPRSAAGLRHGAEYLG